MLVCRNCHFSRLSDKLRQHRFFQSRAENPSPAPRCSFSLCAASPSFGASPPEPELLCRCRSHRCHGWRKIHLLRLYLFIAASFKPPQWHRPLAGQFYTVVGYRATPESFSDVFLPRAKTLFLWLGAAGFITREMIIFDYLNICYLSGTSLPS